MNKDYSVIPINWLLETDIDNVSSSSVKYCYWPPFRVTSIHLKEATDPDPSWQQYQIKVVGGNKTYGNFNKAWYKRVEVESTDTENVLNDPFLSKKKNIFDSSDSDNEDFCYTVIPNIQGSSMLGTFPKESLQTSSTVNSASVSSAVAFTSYKENSYTNLEPLTLFDSNSIASMIQDSDYMHSFLSKTSESSNSVSQVPTQNEESMASQNQPFPNTIENSSEVRKRIKDIGTISQRQFQRRIENKILQLLHNNPAITKHSNIQSSSQVTNSNTIKSVFR